jgi:microcystin-dependent protein
MLADRVRETTTTTGTGTYQLGGAVSGRLSFVDGFGSGKPADYICESEDGSEFEIGTGLITEGPPDTLTRAVIHNSSNAGAAVSWGAGTRKIYCSQHSSYSRFGGGLPTATGTANARVVAYDPPCRAYRAGQEFWFINGAAANTDVATANMGPGVLNVRKGDGSIALGGGDMPASTLIGLRHDGTQFILIHPVSGIPTGSVFPFAGSSAPGGYLLCAGQAVSRTTYAALFTLLSTTYGVGDGSTTFNLPDLRGRAPFGKDDMDGSAANRITNSGGSGIDGTDLGADGGSELMHQHSHSVTDSGHSHNINPVRGTTLGGGQWVQPANSASAGTFDAGTSSATTGISIANTGGGSSQNMPPAIILNYIIKT